MTRIKTSLAVALLVHWQASVAAQPDVQASQHGQTLYMSNNCYQCHGTVGQGGEGPVIAPPRLVPEADFSAYLRHPAGRMPPYTTAALDDADLAAIYRYLQSLPAPSRQLPDLLSRPSAASGQ